MAKHGVFLTTVAFLLVVAGRSIARAEDPRCYVQDRTPSSEPAATIFEEGKRAFAAKRWEEAAPRLRDVAMNHPRDPSSDEATRLYLESLNQIGTKLARDVCFDEMAADTPKLLRLHCSDATSKGNETCSLLDAVQLDIHRLAAQKTIERADKTESQPIAISLYRDGAEQYLTLFKDYCATPSQEGRRVPDHCDELAYNAARGFKGARDPQKAITSFRMLLAFDDRVKLKSDLVRRAAYEIGGLYQQIAIFDLAAEWYEKYAQRSPKDPDADRALTDATILRLGLGQHELAERNLQLFTRTFGTRSPAQHAQLILAIASHHAEKKDWNATRLALVPNIRFFERAPIDLNIRAHAVLARAGVDPAVEFGRIRAMANAGNIAEQINRAWDKEDEVQRLKRFAHALNAIGEATVFLADKSRSTKVDSIRMPTFSGATNDKKAVLAFVDTNLKEWYQTRTTSLEEAEKEYLKVFEVGGAGGFPPPKWVVLSAVRVGFMWADFADALASPPIKAFLASIPTNAGRNDARVMIDSMRDHLKTKKAKPALLKARELAAKYQFTPTDDSRGLEAAEEWLSKNFKTEHYGVPELLPLLYETPTVYQQGPVRE